jgi:hypothetical protein
MYSDADRSIRANANRSFNVNKASELSCVRMRIARYAPMLTDFQM